MHHAIFHDETCIHANDQESFVWMKEGEQPLRQKSRGRIVHVSDFIIEHCGRITLSEAEIAAQLLLPEAPQPPSSIVPTNAHDTATDLEQRAAQSSTSAIPVDDTSCTSMAQKPCAQRKRKQPDTDKSGWAAVPPAKKAKKVAVKKTKNTKGNVPIPSFIAAPSINDNEWVPPPPPAPFTSYRLSSFNARRIIHPGSGYDPWWNMPQLIAQVRGIFRVQCHEYLMCNSD